MLTPSLEEFGLYFTAAVESFSKAEQEFLDHSSGIPVTTHCGEECSLKCDMLSVWFETALVICKADFPSRCQLGMFVCGIALL